MKLSITVQTPEVHPTVPVALLSGSLKEKIHKAAALGADGVELMTTNPRELNAQEIQRSLKENNLEVSAIASGGMAFTLGLTLLHSDEATMERARTRLYDLMDFAVMMDAPVVTIGSFRGRVASIGANGCIRLAEILGAAAAYAQSHSIRLALEAVNRFEGDFISNHQEGLAFIEEVGQPALGLLLDTFHVNIEESSWTEPFRIALQAGKLFHVHLGDNNRLPPGRGLIDFPAIVETLRHNGYPGYLSAELLAKPDPDTAAQQTLTYMRKLLER